MRCDEFIRRLNERLDRGQAILGEDLTEHLADCDACHHLWISYNQCVDFLRSKTLSPSDDFTDEIILQATESQRLRRRQQIVVCCSFLTTLAAGLLVIASIVMRQDTSLHGSNGPPMPNHPPALTGLSRMHSSETVVADSDVSGIDDQVARSEWYEVAWQWQIVRELRIDSWLGEESNSPVAASVTSGLRPVATTISSAIKVIGQRILPVYRTPSADEGQAASMASATALEVC